MNTLSPELVEHIDRAVSTALSVRMPQLSNTGFITLQEAATYLKCSTVHIWALRKGGKLHALKSGKKVLFSKVALDEYIKSNTES